MGKFGGLLKVVRAKIRQFGLFPFVILCGKPKAGEQIDNAGQLDAGAEWRKASPYLTDRGTAQ